MGVVIESPGEVFGLGEGMRSVMHRTQPEGVQSGPGDTDQTLHSLRRFLKLAASGNPSIVMCLWAPVLMVRPLGGQLLDLAPAFAGRHAIPRYRGYMQSQGLRLLGLKGSGNHGKRGSGGRPELIAAHGYDTKYAMHSARLGFQGIELVTTGKLALPIEGEPADWLRAVRRGDVTFNEWWERSLDLDSQLAVLQYRTDIRPGPDKAAIEAFSVAAHRAMWADDRSKGLRP